MKLWISLVTILLVLVTLPGVLADCCSGDPVCDGTCEDTILFGEVCSGSCLLEEGDSCGLGSSNGIYSCGFGTECSIPLGSGECVDQNACREVGQGCDQIGINSCCSGLKCSTFTGLCEEAQQAGESCIPLNNDCADGLECDGSTFLCAHTPREKGEGCGILDPCADDYYCDGTCKDRKDAKEECSPLIENNCKAGLVCDIYGECRHNPPLEGEFCDKTIPIFPQCAEGHFCNVLRCEEKRGVGEECFVSSDCKDDLDCRLSTDLTTLCFPPEGNEIYDEETCVAMHSDSVHDDVTAGDTTITFGLGSSQTIGVGVSSQLGVAYGSDGEFGCYLTTCIGGETNIGVTSFTSFGQFNSYDGLRGTGTSLVQSGGVGVVDISIAEEFEQNGEFAGVEESIGIGISFAPLAVGLYQCTNFLDTYIKEVDGDYVVISSVDENAGTAQTPSGATVELSSSQIAELVEFNEPPVAVCSQGQFCLGEDCMVEVTVNNGSYDPEGGALTIEYNATGPFDLGTHDVLMTVTDPQGATDSCVAHFEMRDCVSPTIYCPEDVEREAQEVETEVELQPIANDDVCGGIAKIKSNYDGEFEVGKHTVSFIAYDVSGNTAACNTKVEITDTEDPDLECPKDVIIEASTADGTYVPLVAQVSDNGDESPEVNHDGRGIYPIGRTKVTFTAIDDSDNKEECHMYVDVRDTIPPIVECDSEVIVDAESSQGASVQLTARARDLVDSNPLLMSNQRPIYPIGATLVTFSAEDFSGNQGMCTTRVVVKDATSPQIHSLIANPSKVTGRDQQLVEVALSVHATDPVDTSVSCAISKVTSSEENSNDIFQIDSSTLQLRVEVTNNARWYDVIVTCFDVSGNTVSSSVQIPVVVNSYPFDWLISFFQNLFS